MKKSIKVSMLMAMIPFVIATMVATSCGGGGSKPKTNEAAQTKEAAAERKLPFERGSYVELSNTLGMEIEKTIYFDKWGEWTAAEEKSETAVRTFIIKTHKVKIVKGKTHWELDLIKKTGKRYELDPASGGMEKVVSDALAGQMTAGLEVKELGEDNHLGYTCKKTYIKSSSMEVTTLSYGKLTMKIEGKMGGMTVSTVITSIDLNPPPASIFEVPEGIEIHVVN